MRHVPVFIVVVLLVSKVASAQGVATAEELLFPAPGRAPLVVESSGAGQQQVELEVVDAFGAKRISCDTPCTFYVSPGHVSLETTGPEMVTGSTDVQVPSTGVLLKMRAPSRSEYIGGIVLTSVGATSLAGAAAMIFPAARDRSAGLIGATAVLAAVGAAVTTYGGILLAQNRPGIDVAKEVRLPRNPHLNPHRDPRRKDEGKIRVVDTAAPRPSLRASVGMMVLPGGGMLSAALTF